MTKVAKIQWNRTKLGSLGEFRNGVNFSRDKKGQGFHLINVKDIFNGGGVIDFDSLDRVDLSDVKGVEKYFVQKNDLYFVRSSVKRDGIGLVGRARRSDSETVHCGFVIRYRLTNPDVEPIFLTYMLRSPYYRQRLIGLSGGAAIINISQDVLSSLTVPLPSFSIQRNIAAILATYDSLLENNTKRIKILKEMAQAIYKEWFVDFHFPGHKKVKMIKSKRGMIPEGWEVKRIGEVIETLGGGTPSTKQFDYWDGGDINWYTPSDLTAVNAMFIEESSRKITSSGLESSSAKMFPAYSVMMTSRATIGVLAINTKPACTNQGFITCIPHDRLSAYHVYFWIEEIRDEIIGLASGATFKEISRGEFRELPIILPPSSIEEAFKELVEPLGRQIENLLNKNNNLRKTRDLLLPKLMSGAIDVEDMKIDAGQ